MSFPRRYRPITTPQVGRVEILRQEVERIRAELYQLVGELELEVEELASSESGAPTDAEYVTYAANATLTNERRLVDGTNTTVNTSVAGQISIDATSVTDEHIRDVAGAMVASTGSIALTFDDLADEITADLQPLGVDTGSIAADAVTFAKMQNIATDRLVGRDTAGSGDPEEIAVTNGLAFTGSGSIGIANDGVTFAKIQNISTDSLLGRDAAGSGDVEEITVTNGIAFTGTGRIGIANDGVTFARMQNVSTDILLGRDTAGSGDIEEITLGDGLLFSGAGVLSVDAAAVATRVIYSVDFTTLANNTFVNGTETIDGLNWTCASTSNTSRTIFDIQNGTGLRWTAPTSSATDFTSATQTAAHIYIDLSAFSLWRPEEELIIEIQYTGTFENGNDGFLFGLWGQANTPIGGGTSVSRVEMFHRTNSGGTQTLRSLHNTTVGTGIVDVNAGGTTDVVMGKFRHSGTADGFFGTYSGGFPTAAYDAAAWQVTTQNTGNPMMCRNTRLVLAFRSVSDASPTSAVTITRMRLRRAI